MVELEKWGVDSRSTFYPIHLQPPYKNESEEKYPVAENLSRTGINLPSGNTTTKEQVKYVANSIKSLLRER
jgi:perosamine synthetase